MDKAEEIKNKIAFLEKNLEKLRDIERKIDKVDFLEGFLSEDSDKKDPRLLEIYALPYGGSNELKLEYTNDLVDPYWTAYVSKETYNKIYNLIIEDTKREIKKLNEDISDFTYPNNSYLN
ncbi:MAG: hypothetical protein HUJ68_12495 [Clostridia bacterium]|nr:hypothetical protein [Clostridia bacterium]